MMPTRAPSRRASRCDGPLEEVDDVVGVDGSHRAADAATVGAAVARRPAGVAVDHGVAGIHEHLGLVEQMYAVAGIRSAVDLQDDRERPLPRGLGHPAVDRVAVAALDRQLAREHRIDPGRERRQRARAAAFHDHELAERGGGRHRGDDPLPRGGMAADLDVAAEQLRDLTGPRHPQQAHAAARAVLHEEVVADRGDVAADLAEVDRLGIREPTRTVLLEKPQRHAGSDEVDAGRRPRRTRAPRSTPSSATAASEIERFDAHPDQLALARSVGAHGDQPRAQIAPVVLDLVDDGEHLLAAEHHSRIGMPHPTVSARAS